MGKRIEFNKNNWVINKLDKTRAKIIDIDTHYFNKKTCYTLATFEKYEGRNVVKDIYKLNKRQMYNLYTLDKTYTVLFD